jgi:hypothetical protein
MLEGNNSEDDADDAKEDDTEGWLDEAEFLDEEDLEARHVAGTGCANKGMVIGP